MSLARLSALVWRAAAPPGRVGQEAALPAFDAPAAVDTAMLQAGLGTMTPPARARREAAPAPRTTPMPRATPMAREEPPGAVTLTARLATPEARATVAAPVPSQPAPHAAAIATPPDTASPVRQPGSPARIETAAAMPAPTLADIASSPAAPVLPDALPVAAQPVAVTPSVPVAEAHAAPPPPRDPVTAPQPALTMPSVAPAPATAAMTAPDAPAITIGTVEVVIAPPPRQKAPALPARPAPDRGFSRYAAMRSGRDRAW